MKRKTAELNDKIVERVNASKYACVYQTLLDILASEVKMPAVDGTSTVDYAASCAEIKQRARIALDFVDNMDKVVGDDNDVAKNKQKGGICRK